MMTTTCVGCGRPVTTGRTDGPKNNIRCLICETARLFQGWRFPASLTTQAKARKRKAAK